MPTTSHSSEVGLVTGVNKGIGREVVRRLAAEGMTVYLGARDEVGGRRAAWKLGGEGAVRFVQLDVTNQAHIDAAIKNIDEEFGWLDALVNNARIAIEWGDAMDQVTVEQVRRTYEVNVFGAVAVTRACIPLLRRSPVGRMVNLSSPLGSLSLMSDPEHPVSRLGMLAYSSPKSAHISVTPLYATALRESGILVNAVSPGHVATDLNGHRGHRTAEQGEATPVKLALLSADRPTGIFVGSENGAVEELVPW